MMGFMRMQNLITDRELSARDMKICVLIIKKHFNRKGGIWKPIIEQLSHLVYVYFCSLQAP